MELRDRILAAATAVYSETGFRGATTRRIAERAGVNEITLFRHFGSKTRLLHEAIKCAGLGSASCDLPDVPRDPKAELLVWTRATYRLLHDRRSLIRTALAEVEERPDLMPMDQTPSACAGRALRGYLVRLSAAGWIDESVNPHAAAMMLMGTLFGDALTREFLPENHALDPEQSLEHYVALFVRALGLEEPVA